MALAEKAEVESFGPQEIAWLDCCEAELGNVRAALEWSTGDGGEPLLGLRLGAALLPFWETRGGPAEGVAWLERGLARGAEAPPAARAKSMVALGLLSTYRQDYQRAAELLAAGLSLYRAVADPRGSARAQLFLGYLAWAQGQAERSDQLFEAALAGFKATGDTAWQANALFLLGLAARLAENYDRARALMEEALGLSRAVGLGSGEAASLGSLGSTAFRQGDLDRAEAFGRQALALRLKYRDRFGVAETLIDLALVLAERGDEEQAARLYAAASALRESIGVGVPAYDRERDDRFLRTLRERLGEDRFAAAWAAGRALSMEEAVAEALATDASGGRAR